MKKWNSIALAVATLALAGCGQDAGVVVGTPGPIVPAVDMSSYMIPELPEDAASVIETREQAKDGDEVILVGRVGGSSNPWIDGRVAFSIVDESLKACSDIEGDECAMPWDYCCETDKLPGGTALVKFVDGEGNIIEGNAKELLDIQELSTVIIKGEAARDDAGNLTVLARGAFIKQK